LQKLQRYSGPGGISLRLVASACILCLLIAFSSFRAIDVNTVRFKAADGVEITADEYIVDKDRPYILLFHEQGSSRGEFKTIARRLCKINYNCLAVDLRNGGSNNYVSNETVKQLRDGRASSDREGIEQDMLAAIRYAHGKSNLPVILFGSGANGSLSLLVSLNNENTRAVVALSPGEYFLPELKIQDTIAHLHKPVFITSSKAEFPYVSELASGIDREYLTLFEPSQGEGERGTVSLSAEYDQNTEYWIALILFFKELM
jgi:dienelactone hydrolase